MTKFQIIDRDSRKVVATCRTELEANRLVGKLNRAIGSSCQYGWRRNY